MAVTTGLEYVKRSRVAWSGQAKMIGERNKRLYINKKTSDFLSRHPEYEDKCIWDLKLLDPACHVNIEDHYNRFLEFLDGLLSSYVGGGIAVDLACGTGDVTEKVLSKYFSPRNIVGIDFAEGMIDAANGKLPDVTWLVGEAKDISNLLEAGSADIVVCRGELPNHLGLDYWQEVGREVYNILKKGGYFMFDFLDVGWYNSKNIPRGKRPKKPLYHANEIEERYRDLGYSVDIGLRVTIAPVVVARK